jgi:hypothetical protein
MVKHSRNLRYRLSKRIKKTNKRNKISKTKKTRRQRGGVIYGRGYGANCYDPNYSIYNTNMLKLFPFSPK